MLIAGTGPKNVELAAEIADAWEPIFFHPERAERVWAETLSLGKAKRQAPLGELQIVINVPVAIGEHADELLDHARPALALYIGGMGARGRNFYNDLARRYGYEDAAKEIQDLYLDGKKREAEAAVPEELIRATTLIGPAGYVKERLAAFAAAGVTTINVQSVEEGREARHSSVEQLLALS